MITVNVWLPSMPNVRSKVGHASMSIGSTYLSWWPDWPEGKQDWRVVFGHNVHPIHNRNLAADVYEERCEPKPVRITGLDESAILEWWRSFGLVHGEILLHGPLLPYNLWTLNCSTVVARGLKIGGGDKYTSRFASPNIIWRPQAVLDYAQLISDELAKQK